MVSRRDMARRPWLPGLAATAIALFVGASGARAVDDSPSVGVGPPCAVLLGGGGTRVVDATQNHSWFLISEAVSKGASDEFTDRGYRIVESINEVQDGDEKFQLAHGLMVSMRCTQLIQIFHTLTPPEKPNGLATVTFGVDVFHLEDEGAARGGRTLRAAGDYHRDYSYVIDAKFMKTSLSGIGQILAADVDAAKVLVKPS